MKRAGMVADSSSSPLFLACRGLRRTEHPCRIEQQTVRPGIDENDGGTRSPIASNEQAEPWRHASLPPGIGPQFSDIILQIL